MGCGSSAAAPTTTPAPKPASVATPLAWLTNEAKPANKRLNQDQAAVLAASQTNAKISTGTFFAHLASACTAMLGHARQARRLPKAPSPTLASAWQSMATATANYASDCLAVTRTHSTASLDAWNASLTSMNTANVALNSVVTAIRSAGSSTSGG